MPTRWKGLAAALAFTLFTMAGAPARGEDDVAQGRKYYVRYCSSCHGLAADGKGPIAPILKVSPSDLRRLAQRHGSPLPLDKIARFMDGSRPVTGHGNSDTPVWGKRFHETGPDTVDRQKAMRARVDAVLAYLSSIQLKPKR